MQGTLSQHRELVQALQSSPHSEAPSLAADYTAWIEFGFQLAWPDEQRLWEQQGDALVKRAKTVLGEDEVQQLLTKQ